MISYNTMYLISNIPGTNVSSFLCFILNTAVKYRTLAIQQKDHRYHHMHLLYKIQGLLNRVSFGTEKEGEEETRL